MQPFKVGLLVDGVYRLYLFKQSCARIEPHRTHRVSVELVFEKLLQKGQNTLVARGFIIGQKSLDRLDFGRLGQRVFRAEIAALVCAGKYGGYKTCNLFFEHLVVKRARKQNKTANVSGQALAAAPFAVFDKPRKRADASLQVGHQLHLIVEPTLRTYCAEREFIHAFFHFFRQNAPSFRMA